MPQGRSTFSRSEVDQIRRLVREKQTADRDRQKSIRGRLRAMGFRISDFADYPGFVESDLDDLITRGTIVVVDAPAGDSAPVPRRRPSRQAVVRRRESAPTSDARRDELAHFATDAVSALARRAPLDQAARSVPPQPGLYAIYGDAMAWRELTLGDPPDKRPLYVGKAEDSLVSRDLATHFGIGRTGSSTVRRSFAALLCEPLQLDARPRNPKRPERFANYGLAPEQDEVLTAWMRKKLELAVWPKPATCELSLAEIEVEVLARLLPPLNLKDVRTPWAAQVKAARSAMADAAKRWALTNSES